MAKVYLFREIEAPDDVQKNVFEEAVASVVENVLGGNKGCILNYGDWRTCPDLDVSGDAALMTDPKKGNAVTRIINDIFTHVYTMELTMEINISIRHIEINMQQSTLESHETSAEVDEYMRLLRAQKEHFVSTPRDVYAYMEKTMKRISEGGHSEEQENDASKTNNKAAPLSGHSLFSIHVKQTNLEQSKKLHGKLNLLHFVRGSEHPTADTSMSALLKIIKALANNNKTHMRYHNIRLTRLLKEILGSGETTVIINYTASMEPQEVSAMGAKTPPVVPTKEANLPAEVWRSLYRRERYKYRRLKEKVLNLEFWGNSGDKMQLDDLFEGIEDRSSSNTELNASEGGRDSGSDLNRSRLALEIDKLYGKLDEKQVELERNYELCQRIGKRCEVHSQLFREQHSLQDEMHQIKVEAELTIDELMDLQQIMDQLSQHHDQSTQQLERKNEMLQRLTQLLEKANDELRQQKCDFRIKLNEYSDMFSKLWRQQALAMQAQEEQREEQLSEMFDTICKELHNSHQTQLTKLKQQAEQKERQLQALHQQHLQLVETAKQQQRQYTKENAQACGDDVQPS
ncbi:kinesin heavy chain [Scaptodrosophila lebanonensis]|uniref:Kinesin heavy chain n=1 Tax=Drosophila lebanonensis TaxID=7225 RepID=A0A6J2T5S3_DROLE|nr:kinesin heavy chain [Scaptodrosophila lebanonensis]